MKRRKKWKAPNNPTAQAKIIWRAVYNEPWPKGWKVKWVGFMRSATGLTDYRKKVILLNYGDAKSGDRYGYDHRDYYRKAIAEAFWHALYMKDKGAPRGTTDKDGYVTYTEADFARRRYEWWARRASMLRLEMARHATLERGAIEVLLHEFVHVRQGPGLKHGKEFDRLVEWSRAKLMEATL
jgi:hypothetical protein